MKSLPIPSVFSRDSINRFRNTVSTERVHFAPIFNRELLAAERSPLSDQNVTDKSGSALPSFPKQSLPFPSMYTVKKGDTLWRIAENMKEQLKLKENIPNLVDKIARDNNLTNPSLILAGQNLNLGGALALADADNRLRMLAGRPALADASDRNPDQEKGKQAGDFKETGLIGKSLRMGAKDSLSPGPTEFRSTSSQTAANKSSKRGSLLSRSRGLVASIKAVSRQNGVDPVLSQAIARAESGLNNPLAKEAVLDAHAVNPDGKSFGIFQLIDETGHRLHQMLGFKAPYNPFHARQNIQLGIGYLKYLDRIFSRESILTEKLNSAPVADGQERQKFMAAAFNAGEGRVARAQQQALAKGKDPASFENIKPFLPSITQNYVHKVWRIMARLNNHFRLDKL